MTVKCHSERNAVQSRNLFFVADEEGLLERDPSAFAQDDKGVWMTNVFFVMPTEVEASLSLFGTTIYLPSDVG